MAAERIVHEATLLAARDEKIREHAEWIVCPSYVGNYSHDQIIVIYRKWAEAILVLVGEPTERAPEETPVNVTRPSDLGLKPRKPADEETKP